MEATPLLPLSPSRFLPQQVLRSYRPGRKHVRRSGMRVPGTVDVRGRERGRGDEAKRCGSPIEGVNRLGTRKQRVRPVGSPNEGVNQAPARAQR